MYEMPGRPSKYAKRGATKRATKSGRYQRVAKGKKRTGPRSNRPRHLLNRSPFRGANVYPFTRSTTEYLQSWTAPDDHYLFSMNSDSTYFIMKMKMQLSALPDYDEFRTLFTQYRITSWKTTITPTFKDNQPYVAQHDPTGAAWAQINPAIPNMEMFIIPATYNVHTGTRDWANLNGADTEDILLQTQLKARKVVPSRGFSFQTKSPLIVKTGFMPGKGNSTAATTETHLGKAPWLENGKGPHADPAGSHPDQRDISHYGYTVLVRRVDGQPLTQMQPYDQNNPGQFGWRVSQQAFIQMQKVR